jgi:anti-sigma factor RsiW
LNCQEAGKLLHPYLDDELDLIRSLEFEEHLRTCRACAQAVENQRVLRTALDSGSLYYEASPALAKRVRAALAREERVEVSPRRLRWGWPRIGFGVAFAALAVWSMMLLFTSPSGESALEQELVSSHVRSLMADHLTDVLSTDQHTVKPWFSGKLDFSPQVSDLSQQGFTLIGGRLEYIGNRSVAALVYQRRKHIINVYIWPSPADANAGKETAVRQGYNLVRWTARGMTYWAVSDIARADLQELQSVIANL